LKEDLHFKNESWKLDIKSKNETIKSRNILIENLEEELSEKKEILKILTKQVQNFENQKENEIMHQSD
jgi:exosome complex RNA-binding protein Rrp4